MRLQQVSSLAEDAEDICNGQSAMDRRSITRNIDEPFIYRVNTRIWELRYSIHRDTLYEHDRDL